MNDRCDKCGYVGKDARECIIAKPSETLRTCKTCFREHAIGKEKAVMELYFGDVTNQSAYDYFLPGGDGYIGSRKAKNMTKRERFEAAGGFLCKSDPIATKGTSGMPAIYIEDLAKLSKAQIDVITARWKANDATEFSCKRVLSNASRQIWATADGRSIAVLDMADKHLVNTMRWLVKNTEKIINEFNAEREKAPAAMQIQFKYITPSPTAIALPLILPIWPKLCSEIGERFGAEALASLLDGN